MQLLAAERSTCTDIDGPAGHPTATQLAASEPACCLQLLVPFLEAEALANAYHARRRPALYTCGPWPAMAQEAMAMRAQ
jgi:hypothetical protein